ncbi:YgcG family protein [Leptospira langatensis]|uniref:YgcG family protein n=1 Tax=Leptospira langatensis TaxID=2484983 RepID=A0A5F1ZW41_9LEPT|nr:YgcG family protein [Leptospira langatensis]TGK00163.1 YgcG family protein [Leptospira langatensis]TGL42799.1 YgcG family protein [Leptospira langatensis]
MKRFWFLLLFCLWTAPMFSEPVPIPQLSHRVTDLTGTLTDEEAQSLETKLKEFEKKKGSQVVLLIIPTTGEETIEQYSIRVADEWKIGRKKIADGVIFLVAKDDRKMRFEIGRGLEGAIPDVLSKRIQVEYVRPLFKEGKYYEGIDQGIDRILSLIDGEPLPEPTHTTFQGSASNPDEDSLSNYFWILIGIAIFIGFFLRRLFSPIQAGIATGIAYYVGGFLGLSLEALLPILFIFFIIAWVAYAAAKSSGGGGGGWTSWGSGGGGSWGSSSGGSFGGGGGDFGGGGSSSDW